MNSFVASAFGVEGDKKLSYPNVVVSVERDNNACISLYVDVFPNSEFLSFPLTEKLRRVFLNPDTRNAIFGRLVLQLQRQTLYLTAEMHLLKTMFLLMQDICSRKVIDPERVSLHHPKNIDTNTMFTTPFSPAINRNIHEVGTHLSASKREHNQTGKGTALHLGYRPTNTLRSGTGATGSSHSPVTMTPVKHRFSLPLRKRKEISPPLTERDELSIDPRTRQLPNEETFGLADDGEDLLLESDKEEKTSVRKTRLSLPNATQYQTQLTEQTEGRGSVRTLLLSSAGKSRPGTLFRQMLSTAPLKSNTSRGTLGMCTSVSVGDFSSGTRATSIQKEGFENMGNTCYINAVLQALLNLPSLTRDLLQKSVLQMSIPPTSLYRCFTNVYRAKESRRILSPKEIKDCIGKTAKQFESNTQEDAEEFLREFLDRLHGEFEAAIDTCRKDTENRNPNDGAKRDSAETCVRNRTPVSDNFDCEIKHVITCKGCKNEVVNVEKCRGFALDLPNIGKGSSFLDLQILLKAFFEPTIVNYTCEKCKTTKATVYHFLAKAPRVMILQLKRFDLEPITLRCIKRQDAVNIVLNLNLVRWSDSLTKPPPPQESEPWEHHDSLEVDLTGDVGVSQCAEMDWKQKLPSCEEQMAWALRESQKSDRLIYDNTESKHSSLVDDHHKYFYRLKSVISHVGSRASSGHYICDVYDAENKSWKCYNDSAMEEVGDTSALTAKRRATGYLFLYVHRDFLE